MEFQSLIFLDVDPFGINDHHLAISANCKLLHPQLRQLLIPSIKDLLKSALITLIMALN